MRCAWLMALLTLLGCSDDGGALVDGSSDVPTPDSFQWKLDGNLPQPDVLPLDSGQPDAPAPDTGPQGDGGALLTAPFLLKLDADNGGLTGTRDWEWGLIKFKAGTNCGSTGSYKAPTAGHSGKGMWGTRLNDCYDPRGNASSSCSNKDTTDDSILTLKARIPASFSTASLSYWEWRDYDPDFDWSEVRINGKVMLQVCKGASASPVWAKRAINVSAYIGKTITIQFHFMATSVVNDAGWYIDDIALTQ